MQVRPDHADIVEDAFGVWPTFHDAEILQMIARRGGPREDMDILVPRQAHGGPQHFILKLAFHEVDDLILEAFTYQNVIWSLNLERVTAERFATGVTEERLKINIASVFGAACSFTCSRVEVVGLESTGLKTGNPPADETVNDGNAQPECPSTEG